MHAGLLCRWSSQELSEKLPAPSTMLHSEPAAALPGEGMQTLPVWALDATVLDSLQLDRSSVQPPPLERPGRPAVPEGAQQGGDGQGLSVLHPCPTVSCSACRAGLCQKRSPRGLQGACHSPRIANSGAYMHPSKPLFLMLYIRHFAQQPWALS